MLAGCWPRHSFIKGHRHAADMQKLRDDGGSALATIPRQYLERDGVLDEDGEVPENQSIAVDRIGDRAYVVLVSDGSALPDFEDTETVQRIVAQKLLRQDTFGAGTENPHSD